MVVLRGNIANRKIKSGWTYSLLGGLSGSCVTRIFCSIISIGSTSWWKLVPSLCGKCVFGGVAFIQFSHLRNIIKLFSNCLQVFQRKKRSKNLDQIFLSHQLLIVSYSPTGTC